MAGAVRRALQKAQLAVREVVALSPRTMLAITRNSVVMWRHDRRWRRDHAAGTESGAGAFTGASEVGVDALACTYERATLHVRALSDGLVRLQWGPGAEPSDVATRRRRCVAPTTVRRAIGPTSASLSTTAVSVTVDDGGVVVTDAAGRVRYAERTPLHRGPHHVLRRVLREGERVCGLGEQAAGLDLAGGSFRLWNRDPGGSWGPGQDPLYCGVPITVGLHDEGPVWAFHENSHEATVTIGRVAHAPHGVECDFHDGALVTYVAVGELDELLTTAASLLGAPSLPPRWALGYHHCRWGWRTDQAVRDVLDGFVSRSIPLSALHLDIDHLDSFKVFTVDDARFGRLGQLASAAADAGARLVAIVDPAVRRDASFSTYAEGVELGHFVRRADGEVLHGTVWPGWAAFPDFCSEATRKWWGSKYAELERRGFAGAWHDMNEPTSITLWGDRTLPRDAVHDLDGRPATHAEAHNLYGLFMDEAGHAALAESGRRPFVLSRSGWAGLSRAAWHWTADVESSEEGLAQQVATFLGLGLSSIPFMGSDLGGFNGSPSPELYVRWLELGVISPFCRTHCVLGAPDREPWRFDPPYDLAIGRLLRLRYRLLPHLYRLAVDANRLGHPMLRPLDWPVGGARTGARADARALLLGDELVVVPVASPTATDVTARLPEGRWLRRRWCEPVRPVVGATEPTYDGDGDVRLDAPLGQPVVLQRVGTVVVLDDGWVGDDPVPLAPDHAALRWSLHVALGPDGATGEGYDDEGDGSGPSRRDRYVATATKGAVALEWSSEGSYRRRGAVRVVVSGFAASSARCDGRDVAVEPSGESSVVELEGPFERLELRGSRLGTP